MFSWIKDVVVASERCAATDKIKCIQKKYFLHINAWKNVFDICLNVVLNIRLGRQLYCLILCRFSCQFSNNLLHNVNLAGLWQVVLSSSVSWLLSAFSRVSVWQQGCEQRGDAWCPSWCIASSGPVLAIWLTSVPQDTWTHTWLGLLYFLFPCLSSPCSRSSLAGTVPAPISPQFSDFLFFWSASVQLSS